MNQFPAGTIVFDGVSKRYRLGELGTLRGALGALGRRGRDGDGPRDLWALKDLSFRVQPGDSLGLIGPNGAGKTTTLKLLSRITQPTSGGITVVGRTSSLIELGAGFHPELTGRENIYLNGAILGLKQREIRRRLDAIIAFAQLERFIDTPVKRYSSGMYVRLGYAVAAHVEPDIMLVDEVLAVGDTAFRQRCIQHMKQLQANGTTLVFVSHNMHLVKRVCNRVFLIWEGQLQHDGDGDSSTAAYELMLRKQADEGPDVHEQSASQRLLISGVQVMNETGLPQAEYRHGAGLTLSATCITSSPVPNPVIRVRLLAEDNSVVAMFATPHLKEVADTVWTLEGCQDISVTIPSLEVVSGYYSVEFRILDTTDNDLLASQHSGRFYVRGHGLAHEVDRGYYLPNVIWRLPKDDVTDL